MLEHLHIEPVLPTRVVIIGAGGFVGGAIRKKLMADGINTLPLTRRELNLLEVGATETLAQIVQPTDSVVMVSAVAPVKTAPMLMQNLKMAEVVWTVLATKPIGHLVYI